MVNFRFFIVSLVAVFLALGIGVIMGSAVIDRAVVDRLEDQQAGIENRIEAVEQENGTLRSELRALREASQQLADEGSQRLLDGTLAGVPVVVVGIRGIEASAVNDLVALLRNADADHRGTVWLTDRLALDTGSEVDDLAAVLGETRRVTRGVLRNIAVGRIARSLREAGSAAPDQVPGAETELPPSSDEESSPLEELVALREAGFLDYEAAEGAGEELDNVVAPGIRVVLVSGPGAALANDEVGRRLSEALVADSEARPAAVPVLVAEPLIVDDEDDDADVEPSLVRLVRQDDELRARLSTVDNVDQFAGRLAAVLALVDLGDRRFGHYGQGPGAQRLIPAPPPAE